MASDSSKCLLLLIYMAVASACYGTRLPADDQNAPENLRVLLASVIKSKLDRDLANLRINEKKSGRETTVIKNKVKDIVINTDWEVSISGACDDPQRNSRFLIERLAKDEAGAYSVTLVVTAPMSGEARGEIKTIGKTKVDFHADVRLRVKGSLTRIGEDWTVKITDGDIVIDKLTLMPKVADLLSNKLKDLGNAALAAKKEDLKEKANKALEKAASEGRLKGEL